MMPRKSLVLLFIFSLVGVCGYVLFSAWVYRPGFPLDDSWIHLTYARNLALRAEWSFVPGQNSAGSTSPLWTFLLSMGFFLPLAPYLWTYFLGGLMLFLLAWRVEATLRQMQPAYAPVIPWAGLLIVGEWRLAWASVSGMEILLHAFLVTTVLSMLILNQPRFLLMGILTGLSIWSRPDGLTLLGPLVLFALLQPQTLQQKTSALWKIALGFSAFFVPYLFFNLLLSGTPWPNTFYAKQAEYAYWQAEPFGVKLAEFVTTYFLGTTMLMLPAAVLLVLKAIHKRGWGILLTFTWVAGYIGLYTSRLPLYQYGRYIMPTIPVFLLLGLIFLVFWIPVVNTHRQKLLRFAWLTSMALFGFSLWAYGAYIYARDVAWIESEMVQTAQWAAENVPQGELIAAHDIGALGYFDGRRQVVDLAGLISPEVVPFIRDEAGLSAYLQQKGAKYLIVFPEWYPSLIKDCTILYESDGPYAGLGPSGLMTVYKCPKP
jgi:hypothetical protein